jgi:hypothetical protein
VNARRLWITRRLWILVGTMGLALALAACGQESKPSSLLNDGVYVDAGPLTYQMQVSRELNPYLTEDSQYVSGLPAGVGALGPHQLWYGVFLWAWNQTNHPQLTARVFSITDSNGDRFFPLHLDAEVNGYAWTQQVLDPGATAPKPNTTASFGPTQGGLLLFKLPTSVYSNRPLTLNIVAPNSQGTGQISLDL